MRVSTWWGGRRSYEKAHSTRHEKKTLEGGAYRPTVAFGGIFVRKKGTRRPVGKILLLSLPSAAGLPLLELLKVVGERMLLSSREGGPQKEENVSIRQPAGKRLARVLP